MKKIPILFSNRKKIFIVNDSTIWKIKIDNIFLKDESG